MSRQILWFFLSCPKHGTIVLLFLTCLPLYLLHSIIPLYSPLSTYLVFFPFSLVLRALFFSWFWKAHARWAGVWSHLHSPPLQLVSSTTGRACSLALPVPLLFKISLGACPSLFPSFLLFPLSLEQSLYFSFLCLYIKLVNWIFLFP